MELRQLRHFVAVAEERNFSVAARKVCLSQPALTRSIRNLESDLHTQLLERGPQGALLTSAGERFLEYSRMILSDCERAREEMHNFREGITGQVSMGVAALFASWIGDEVVEQTNARYPDIELTVTEGYFEDMLGMLRSGRIDFALSNFPRADTDADLVMEPLLELRARIIAGATHPLARARRVSPGDLAQARWVLPNQAHSSELLTQLFAGLELAAPRALRTNSLALITTLVAHGGYVTVISDSVMHREMRRGLVKALKVETPTFKRRAGLLYLRQRAQGAAVTRVMQIVRAASVGKAR